METTSRVMKNTICAFAAVVLLCCSESAIAGAEIPETVSGGHSYAQTDPLTAGWREINGQKYYFFPGTGQMATGWQEIDGESYYFRLETGEMLTGRQVMVDGIYYFSPETGNMLVGWQEIDGERCYFSPGSGRMVVGWQKIGGKRYYLSKDTGEAVTGLQEIGQDRYYFDSEGILQTDAWIKSGNKTYYSGKSGTLLTGLQKIGSRTYCFSTENSRMLTGPQEIDGKYYIFKSNGQLAESKGIRLVTVGNKRYCADKNGEAAAGWQLIAKKLYYVTRTGKLKSNTTYQGITLNSKGAAKNDANSRLKIKAMQTFAAITNDSMTKSQKLNACWSYVVGGQFRYAVKYPDLNASGWQRQAAYDMLSAHSGNCYGFACVFAALAEEAGYKPYVICGRVRGSRDRAADGYTRHAWVRINGRYYDPEAHYAGWRRGIYGNVSYPVSHTVQQVVEF